ncbi:unnamed protein product [Prorocentrum cordatum]|uniref:Poly(ADP-ribose) glycohydrolase n=1 Tax=Prorocentrum cordatum TaxID=2364126 RepID=A0ABN9S1Q1_9DINO|nr:unnamed protein product [Polarella glacialis]
MLSAACQCQCSEGPAQVVEHVAVPNEGLPHLPQLLEVEVPEERQRLWVERGGLELDPVLASGALLLLDAGSLIQLASSGGILQPRQTLPPAAFASHSTVRAATHQVPETIGQSQKGAFPLFTAVLRIVCVSHCWLQPRHPDPLGYNLRVLGRALALLLRADAFGPGVWSVFFDLCGLHQACRDREGIPQQRTFAWLEDDSGFADGAVGRFISEEMLFKEALTSLGILYSHPHTIVFMLTQFPPDYDDPGVYDRSGNVESYMNRGWCFMELSLARMVKHSHFSLDLGRATGAEEVFLATTDGNRVRDSCLAGTCAVSQLAPAIPEAFEASLERKIFTAGKVDRLRVAGIYSDTFKSRICKISLLHYVSSGWGDSEAGQLADLIASGMPKLWGLGVIDSRIGDDGFAKLSEALVAPGGPQALEGLVVNHNAVGDRGAARLAEAAAEPGALRSLRGLALIGNRVGDEGAARLAAAAATPGALPALEALNLAGNGIGDRGARALADALASPEALPSLRRLVLSGNARVGGAGRDALQGEFPSVRNQEMLQAGLFV